MYLLNRAKESITKTLQSDRSSPLARLNVVCRFILKITIIVSFSIMVLIMSTNYLGSDIHNKQLLQTFASFAFLQLLLSYTILKRSNGAYTLSKIKMYPFSFKDLIDISITTGTVTISLFDIFLGYLYFLISFLLCFIGGYSVYESLENPNMMDNESINSFTLPFASVLYVGLYLISQYAIFRSMPYHPLEYISYIFKNIFEDIISVLKKLLKFVF